MSRALRREKLCGAMEALGVGALLLRTPTNFSWHTNGADNRVDRPWPLGVAPCSSPEMPSTSWPTT